MTKKTSPSPVSKKAAPKKAAPKKTLPVKKESSQKSAPSKNSLRSLREECYSLKMKHALWELKEVHKLKSARKAIARHLTSLNQK